MTCGAIMNRNPLTAHLDDTIDATVAKMVEHRVLEVPVIDDDGRYLGIFAKRGLFGLLLPGIIAAESQMPLRAHLGELGFLSEDTAELQQRMVEVGQRRVGEFVDVTAPIAHPDTPFVSAIIHFHRMHSIVPVTDAQTGRLLGAISTWDALRRVRDRP